MWGFNLPVPAQNETGTAASAVNSFANWEIGGSGNISQADARKVFVTIIMFDRNYNFQDVTYQASSSSNSLISASYTAKEPGYAYVYVSNEHSYLLDVYFDDIAVSITPSMIIEMTDYYPFGLSISSFTRENSIIQESKYNGKDLQTELGLGWEDFGARMYLPEIGRWAGIDIKADKFVVVSPYTHTLNNPILFVDPDGKDVKPTNEAAFNAIMNTLTADDRAYVQLDKNGMINKDLINQKQSDSGNFQALQTLVNASQTTEFTVGNHYQAKNDKGEVVDEQLGGLEYRNDFKELKEVNKGMPPDKFEALMKDFGIEDKETGNGIFGITLLPNGEKDPKGDGKGSVGGIIVVMINDQANEKDQARTAALEGYGHALFFIIGKDPNHDPVNNPELEEQIKKRVAETEKNNPK